MKGMTLLKILSLFLFFSFFLIVPASHATPVDVVNYSFESAPGEITSQPGYNIWTTEGFDGWVSNADRSGHWRYSTYQYSTPIPDGYWIGYLEGGSIYQDTGWLVSASNEFTLSVDIGNRLDVAFGEYSVELLAGDNVLAFESSVIPTAGQFSTLTMSYIADIGDANIGSTLGIRIFAADGTQLNFDNIRLSNDPYSDGEQPAAPVPEPGTMVLLGIGLAGIAGFSRSKIKK